MVTKRVPVVENRLRGEVQQLQNGWWAVESGGQC